MANSHSSEGKSGILKIRYIERSGGVIAAPGDSLRVFAESHCQEHHNGRNRGMVPIERMGGQLGYWRDGELQLVGKTAHLVSS